MLTRFVKGEIHNKLTLLADMGTSKGIRRFKCKCACGRRVIRRANDVVRGHTKSCGCLNKQLAKKLAEKNKASISRKSKTILRLYARYISGAVRRDLSFKLTYDQFYILVKKKCSYCGIMPKTKLNGIDRIDSSIGYVGGNCITACKVCNMAKWTLTKARFLRMVKRIYKHSIEENK